MTGSEQEADPVVDKLFESSEEGQKVTRNSGTKWCAVFERVTDPGQSEAESLANQRVGDLGT